MPITPDEVGPAVGPTSPARRAADALALLRLRGVVTDEDCVRHGVRIVEQSRSNHVFVVRIGESGGFVVKFYSDRPYDTPGSPQQEIAAYALAATDPEVARYLPSVQLVEDEVLVVDLVQPGEALYAFHHRRGGFADGTARMLGEALAAWHRHATARPNGLPAEIPWPFRLADALPPRFVGVHAGTAPWLEKVRSRPHLMRHARRAAGMWSATTTIHGDVKADNCLLEGKANRDGFTVAVVDRVRLIDWEMADWGDAAWDLAGAVEVLLTQTAGAVTDATAVDVMALLAAVRAPMEEFGAGYGRLGRPDVHRMAHYLPLRFVQSALQYAGVTPQGGPAEMAQAMLDLADEAVRRAGSLETSLAEVLA